MRGGGRRHVVAIFALIFVFSLAPVSARAADGFFESLWCDLTGFFGFVCETEQSEALPPSLAPGDMRITTTLPPPPEEADEWNTSTTSTGQVVYTTVVEEHNTYITNPTTIIRESSGGDSGSSDGVSRDLFRRQIEVVFENIGERIDSFQDELAETIETITLAVSGNASVGGDLNVVGTLTAGLLSVSGVSSGSVVEAPYFTATSTTATSTFSGPLSLGGIVLLGSSATTDNFVVNAVDNAAEDGLIVSTILGGRSGWPNLIGSTGKPNGTDFTPTDWANDTGYVADSASISTISGGYDNIVNQLAGTISGGGHNFLKYNVDGHSIIGGGSYNLISAGRSGIFSGRRNTITGPSAVFSFIGGGDDNNIIGSYSVISGGRGNDVSGDYSYAFGRRAQVSASGAVAFADNTDADFTASVANQFAARYSGGYRLTGGRFQVMDDLAADGTLAQFYDLTSDMALDIRSNTGGSGLAAKHIDLVGGSSVSDLSFSPSTDTRKALVIKDGGNVGIGTASPSRILHVEASGSGVVLRLQRNDSTTANAQIEFTGSDGIADGGIAYNNAAGSSLTFHTGGSGSVGTARMTIDSVGNVGIGTTTIPAKLSIDTTAASTVGLSIRGFPSQSGNLQEWRSSDNTLAGRIRLNNTTGGILEMYQSGTITLGIDGSNARAYFNTTGPLTGNGDGSGATVSIQAANNRAALLIRQQTSQASRLFEIQGTGGNVLYAVGPTGGITASGLVNDSTGYYVCLNTTTGQMATSTTACGASSERFKENIENISYGLDAINALRPVSFTYKDSYIQNAPPQLGFIAEEVELVIPELVAKDAQGTIQGLDYPKFGAVIVRAIQEMYDIIAGFAHSITSENINATERLCVGQTCITENELLELLDEADQQPMPPAPVVGELEEDTEMPPEETPEENVEEPEAVEEDSEEETTPEPEPEQESPPEPPAE